MGERVTRGNFLAVNTEERVNKFSWAVNTKERVNSLGGWFMHGVFP